MERKLVRFTTFFTCIFSLFVCVMVWFLPSIEQSVQAFTEGIRRERTAREERYALLKEMTALEIMAYNTKQVQEQAAREQAAKEQAAKEQEAREQADKAQPDKEREEVKPEEVIVITHQMQLELPKGADGSDVEVVQDPVSRQVEVRIPGADENYLYDYMMLGNSDEIESLESIDYFSEGKSGKVVLSMSRVVAVESGFDKDYFNLDFAYPEDIYDRIIVVDAGHGGSDPGAVSGDAYEKNITLAIVRQIKALFDEAGDPRIGVYFTRLEDSDPSLSDRVVLANSLGADLFLSVHINSLKGNTDVEGIEVMYNELAPDTAFDTKDFAQICLEEEVGALGAKKRDLINGNRIYVIRNSIAPAALVEVGFINNPNELARLLDPSYQRKAAEGIYHALLKSVSRLDEIENK